MKPTSVRHLSWWMTKHSWILLGPLKPGQWTVDSKHNDQQWSSNEIPAKANRQMSRRSFCKEHIRVCISRCIDSLGFDPSIVSLMKEKYTTLWCWHLKRRMFLQQSMTSSGPPHTKTLLDSVGVFWPVVELCLALKMAEFHFDAWLTVNHYPCQTSSLSNTVLLVIHFSLSQRQSSS